MALCCASRFLAFSRIDLAIAERTGAPITKMMNKPLMMAGRYCCTHKRIHAAAFVIGPGLPGCGRLLGL
jgi:hypothetical protein